MARLVFLGTPEAAVPTLETLARDHEVVLVVTQPDRPKGRSGTPSPTPIKETALEIGLVVAQPESSHQLADVISAHGPYDVGVVVAYGRILKPEILDNPAHGMINVHFSLLPRWRGAAPVARALMAGDPMTGVTIMKLDEGLDTGPILTAQAIDIPPNDDAGALTDRLADLGARLLGAILPGYLAGELEAVAQSDEGLTYAEKITKDDRPIDTDGSADVAAAKVRGLAPTPAATLVIDGEPHKILSATPAEARLHPGTWAVVQGHPVAAIGDGALELVRIQPPGRRPMSGKEWINGLDHDHGEIA